MKFVYAANYATTDAAGTNFYSVIILITKAPKWKEQPHAEISSGFKAVPN